eukprot:TRINITY_DN556_c3_g2_i2.p1 TRINITY_DN556_c3_g2~~TRINITY_DN556_c3_g2_i2.p1  ORF type:complete len:414 (+),score=62.34 TRINITY_DN556_c3_g2_i2:110-1351(+)
MQHLHRTPTLGPFDPRNTRGLRSPQQLTRETPFRRTKTAAAGLPVWIRRQGFKGAIVGAFLGGVILCCVVLMGTVVKPEDGVRVGAALHTPPEPRSETTTKAKKPIPGRKSTTATTPTPTTHAPPAHELEDVRTRLAQEIKKNALKDKTREIDKAETDRLREILQQEHFKEGNQQQKLSQRIEELERAHARLQEKQQQVEVERRRRVLPFTISPAYKMAHRPQVFLEGMAVRSKIDVMIGKTVIVQIGALGIIQSRAEKASEEEEDSWKVQFVSTLGKKPAVVPKVKSSEIQKVDIAHLGAHTAKQARLKKISEKASLNGTSPLASLQNTTAIPHNGSSTNVTSNGNGTSVPVSVVYRHVNSSLSPTSHDTASNMSAASFPVTASPVPVPVSVSVPFAKNASATLPPDTISDG